MPQWMFGRLLPTVSHSPLRRWQVLIRQGLYEQQDDDQHDHNLRGKFRTNEKGQYAFYCLRPTPYPVPSDGPAGKLLELMDRHPYRPAHIHFIVMADGHKPITTQIFDSYVLYHRSVIRISLIEPFLVNRSILTTTRSLP